MRAHRQRGKATHLGECEKRGRALLRARDFGQSKRGKGYLFGHSKGEKLFKSKERFAEYLYLFLLYELDSGIEKLFLGQRRYA